MKVNIKCYKCRHQFKSEYTYHYPTGDCPKCKEYGLCPKCGGGLNVPADDEETQQYCGNGCVCGWQHCGGCI